MTKIKLSLTARQVGLVKAALEEVSANIGDFRRDAQDIGFDFVVRPPTREEMHGLIIALEDILDVHENPHNGKPRPLPLRPPNGRNK